MSEKLREGDLALIEQHVGKSSARAVSLGGFVGVGAKQFAALLSAARAEARPAPVVDREAVARIVDPIAFKCWEATYDYGRRIGDSESEALETAEWAHGKSRDEALAKADAILALLSPATSPGEGSSGGRVQAAPSGATEDQHSAEWNPRTDPLAYMIYRTLDVMGACRLSAQQAMWVAAEVRKYALPAERDASSPAEGRAAAPATDTPKSPTPDDAGGGG